MGFLENLKANLRRDSRTSDLVVDDELAAALAKIRGEVA